MLAVMLALLLGRLPPWQYAVILLAPNLLLLAIMRPMCLLPAYGPREWGKRMVVLLVLAAVYGLALSNWMDYLRERQQNAATQAAVQTNHPTADHNRP